MGTNLDNSKFNLLESDEVNVTPLDLTPYRLDPTKEFEPIQYTFSQNGIGLAPKGDIHVVKAPQKNGKTFLISLMAGAALNKDSVYLGIRCEIKTPKILLIDTEQHPRNTQMVYRRICKIAGINGREFHEQIRVYHLRGCMPDFIKQALAQEAETWRPDIIFLDGIVDCVNDPNDMKESKGYITEISKLAMELNCSIWSVLHVNPNTTKMRGHLGTIMGQKTSDVLQCIKEKDEAGNVTFTVSQTDTRNKDINNFCFAVESVKDGNDFVAVPVAASSSTKERAQLNELMQEALRNTMRYSDLVEKIKELEGCQERKAKKLIGKANELLIIKKDNVTGKYFYIGIEVENEKDCPF